VLMQLRQPHSSYPSIQVAGTNGKGSTCAFTAACLSAAGHKVGLYTSPHLVRVNERIQVAGQPIPDALLGRRVQEVLEACPEALAEPAPFAFFELMTLVALWHFAQERVEVAVLETGLGGRLDATTAARAQVTSVTTIAMDHMGMLGISLAEIAAEKAAIFHPGAPALCARQAPEALEVMQRSSAQAKTRLYVEGPDFGVEVNGGRLGYRGLAQNLDGFDLGLRGPHQAHNAAIALAGLELLGEIGVRSHPEHWRQGLAATRWPGRLEELAGSGGPAVVLDGAHNPAAMEALVQAMATVYPGRQIHVVFGVLADKEHRPMMETLLAGCASVHLTPVQSPRSVQPQALAKDARLLSTDVHLYPSAAAALAGARGKARGSDVILCTGSLILLGEIKVALES